MPGASDKESVTKLELRAITKSFGKVKALRAVDLVIDEGEFFSILGRPPVCKTSPLCELG